MAVPQRAGQLGEEKKLAEKRREKSRGSQRKTQMHFVFLCALSFVGMAEAEYPV
jgi:hypothetical protein